ncbi:MAG: hypothetical protein TEF_08285 [Rhizobiales bacterium NRL2]|jgi:hypothetical protein|nr:MAG: hypothetical protein TEF_08285 [Rhizobiales bacterium NRL2]
MSEIKTEPLFTVRFDVPQIRDLGRGPFGGRRIATVTGGRFEGPAMKGEALPSPGGDWLLFTDDGSTHLDVRVTLKTDDDCLIYMTYGGRRHGPKEVMERLAAGEEVDPSLYYFRIAPRFETAAEKYDFLNHNIYIGTGHRTPGGPVYQIHKIL